MKKIGFITCADLSRYFVSAKNRLYTHDDQVAADYLVEHGYEVLPVIWGTPLAIILAQNFDLLIVRSPWDYSANEENRTNFLRWLAELNEHQVKVVNPYNILLWSLDKHYLQDLANIGVRTVTTVFIEPEHSIEKIRDAFEEWHAIVVKPCIAAAAKDATLIRTCDELNAFKAHFASIRGQRAFMVQPFVEEITTTGEWSLVFLNGQYSHAVLKLPKPGGWLVQDELGGSVRCDDPPQDVREFAEDAYAKLQKFLSGRFAGEAQLLYARVDVMPGLRVGELELAEPELFFLDRRTMQPNEAALKKLTDGINDSSASLTPLSRRDQSQPI